MCWGIHYSELVGRCFYAFDGFLLARIVIYWCDLQHIGPSQWMNQLHIIGYSYYLMTYLLQNIGSKIISLKKNVNVYTLLSIILLRTLTACWIMAENIQNETKPSNTYCCKASCEESTSGTVILINSFVCGLANMVRVQKFYQKIRESVILFVCLDCTCCSIFYKDDSCRILRYKWVGINFVIQKTWYEPFVQDSALIYRLSAGGAIGLLSIKEV